MADPWLKFYTADWRSDPRLKMCSAAARGVWIEMICLMHEAMPYGHLLIHGQSPNEAQLASLTGIPHAELPDLIAELERMGVFSRTKEGVIYSRKLVRMASRSAKARKNGKKGGNPSLSKNEEKTSSLNLHDKGEDKPQKPETRNQNIIAAAAAREPIAGGLFEEVCAAAGAPIGTVTPGGACLSSRQDGPEILRRWQVDLDLTSSEIVDEVRRRALVMRAPPTSLNFFTPCMKDLAALKRAPPMQPSATVASRSGAPPPVATNRELAERALAKIEAQKRQRSTK